MLPVLINRMPPVEEKPCNANNNESVLARVAELADALDLGSSGKPWGFESPPAQYLQGGGGPWLCDIDDASSMLQAWHT